MDFNMKQWRNQQQNESEDQEPTHTAKLPKLVLDLEYSSATATASASDSSSALPLFVTEPNNKLPSSTYSDSTTTTVTKFPKMGSYFSMAQWQELELQALIYRHMIAGAPVPPELLHLVQKSLINNSSPYYFPQSIQQYHHYQQALLQSGYWGRTSMDPEPGRCRRTDGKKWRCSRDVVSGHKYCERHVHRGRNRSRKPVEIATTAVPPGVNATTSDSGGGGVLKVNTNMASHASVVPQFSLSGTSPSSDIFRLNRRHPESTIEKNGPLDAQNDGSSDDRSSGQILRHFFDDWPRQQQECDNASSMTSATNLSISMPGNPSSDFSLKLSTGDRHISGYLVNNVERSTWRTNHGSSMGGPLAEALRSSTTNSSPTSVLHQLQRASTLEARYVST